jgi:hypothetical protein
LLAQELRQTNFCNGEVISVEARPNLFIVVEDARMEAPSLVTNQILNSRSFPSFLFFRLSDLFIDLRLFSIRP